MIVLVTIGCPAGLRGDITRWLAEIAAGVYVGKLSARVRDNLWERTCDNAGPGQVLMITPARNEQGYAVKVHNYGWVPKDMDGLTFLARPHGSEKGGAKRKRPWSNARVRRAHRRG